MPISIYSSPLAPSSHKVDPPPVPIYNPPASLSKSPDYLTDTLIYGSLSKVCYGHVGGGKRVRSCLPLDGPLVTVPCSFFPPPLLLDQKVTYHRVTTPYSSASGKGHFICQVGWLVGWLVGWWLVGVQGSPIRGPSRALREPCPIRG